jgi:hypothetical protein
LVGRYLQEPVSAQGMDCRRRWTPGEQRLGEPTPTSVLGIDEIRFSRRRCSYSERMVEEADYPVLFGTTQATWAPIDLRFQLLTGEVDPRRIARVYVVPFVGAACVVVGFEHGDWGPAGGGLEPGEGFRAALERELAEEAGGRLLTLPPVRRAALPFPDGWSLSVTPAEPRLRLPVRLRRGGAGRPAASSP